jgi:hypothetical protein
MVVAVVVVVIVMLGFALVVLFFGLDAALPTGTDISDCHGGMDSHYPGTVGQEDTYVLGEPTLATCEDCHRAEVAQFNQSRHALPAYVTYTGTEDLTATLLERYEGIPEGGFGPDPVRSALFEEEGLASTRFACEGCHFRTPAHAAE